MNTVLTTVLTVGPVFVYEFCLRPSWMRTRLQIYCSYETSYIDLNIKL